MPDKKRNHSLWLKWTIAFIAAVILLLLAGASPVWGVEAIYQSGLMLLLGLCVAVLSLCGIFFIRLKNIGLLLLHAGSVLVLVGAFIDFSFEQKMEGTLFVGQEYIPDPNEGDSIPNFQFTVKGFDIDYYSPAVYALVDLNTKTELEQATADGQTVAFPLHQEEIPLSRIQQALSGPHPFLVLEGDRFLYVKKPAVEKYYRADFLITDTDGQHRFTMAVNHPVTYNGWRFYLMNHGSNETGQYVQLLIRRAPGRPWVQGGILLIVAGAFWFAFVRKRKEATAS